MIVPIIRAPDLDDGEGAWIPDVEDCMYVTAEEMRSTCNDKKELVAIEFLIKSKVVAIYPAQYVWRAVEYVDNDTIEKMYSELLTAALKETE